MNDLILKNREVKEKIIKIINSSNLPAFILRSILKDLFEELELFDNEEYSKALNEKEKDLKELENKEDSK